jgi:thioredoxin 1
MPTVELTSENFASVIAGADLALVDFWAGWCGPCRMFGPVFDRVSQRHADAVFGKVDTEAQADLAASFGISSIPTLMVIRDNVVLYSQAGALPEAALEELIAKARELDMDEVRASVAEHERGPEHDNGPRPEHDNRPRHEHEHGETAPGAFRG